MPTEMVDIDGHPVNLKYGTGIQKKGLCPKCSHLRQKNQDDPCLSVDIETGAFKCHHCKWHGNFKKNGSGSYDSGWPPLPPKYHRPESDKTYRKPGKRYNPTGISASVIKWFQTARGISEDTLAAERIGFGKYFISTFGEERPCVQFPFKRDGGLVNVKHMHFADSKKYPRLESGAELIFYRLDNIDPEMLCITEGEIDALSLVEAGFDSVISVPNGVAVPNTRDYESTLSYLASAEEALKPVKKIILAGDNDEPGQALMNELARRLDVERCYQVIWPAGCKDANDVLVKHGKERLRECIDFAKPWPVAGIIALQDIERDLWDIYQNGLTRGLSTGWYSVDEFYTIKPGEITIVTGVPGHYKSTWLSALFVNMARLHGWRFSLFSPEHSPTRMAITLIQQWTGKPFDSYRGLTSDDLAQAYYQISPFFGWILSEDSAPTIDYVLDRARIEVFRRGIKGLLIDPWNEIDHSRPNNLTETEYISSCLSKLKRFALNNGIHLWVVAHPTKMVKATSGDYAGKYPPPTPYDIQGSSHFRNKANNCLSLWRDSEEDGHIVQIHVQKVKLPEVGHPGVTELEFDKVSARFKNIDVPNVDFE